MCAPLISETSRSPFGIGVAPFGYPTVCGSPGVQLPVFPT